MYSVIGFFTTVELEPVASVERLGSRVDRRDPQEGWLITEHQVKHRLCGAAAVVRLEQVDHEQLTIGGWRLFW